MSQYIKDNGEWKKIGGVEKYPADFGTRAEFEAKKDDLPVGTVFTTTDEFEEGEKEIYSTEEVKTNKVWVDGKPIYRKVFTGLNLTFSSTTSDWARLSTSLDLNYDTLIKVDVHRGGYKVPTIVVSGLKPITYHSNNLAWSNCNILVVEYTKN